MRKPMPAIMVLLFLLVTAIATTINASKTDSEPPTVKPPEPPQQVQIIKVKATAFNEYGYDSNGIDYGPGYCIISNQSEIPLYSLLAIDIYGEAQAIGVSNKMAKDEIKLWYNAPSKIPMFGEQTAYVRILGKGDKPCRLNE
jgi:3D (Asp-Asp-Asp) domain-containing protein